jgi:hypothetical protein
MFTADKGVAELGVFRQTAGTATQLLAATNIEPKCATLIAVMLGNAKHLGFSMYINTRFFGCAAE